MFNKENLISHSTSSYSVITSVLNNIIKDIDENLKNNKFSVDLNSNTKYKKILENNSSDVLINLLESHYDLKGYFALNDNKLVFYSIPYKLSLTELTSDLGIFIKGILNHCLNESKKGNFETTYLFSINRFFKNDNKKTKEYILDYFNDISLKCQVHLKTNFDLNSEYTLNEDNEYITVKVDWSK